MISYIIPDDFGEGMTSEIRAQQEVVRQMLHEEIYAATWNTRDEGTWIEAFDTSNVDIMDPIEHFIYAEEHGAFPGQEDFYKNMIDENGEMLPWDELGPEQQQAFNDYLEYYGLVGESPILTSGDAGGSQEWKPYEYREDGQADAPVNNPAGASDEEFDPMDEVFGDPYPIEEEPEDNG
ncbi:hypothetical protein [Flaviflexus massiliensis]|uniref:hypothetical protein n=1 Tax=Flaviflexus massiliensis TaxID=1522309 RepID=UPI0006D5A8DD|nr:hypothetical protein [Flaviflexus massiliensis]